MKRSGVGTWEAWRVDRMSSKVRPRPGARCEIARDPRVPLLTPPRQYPIVYRVCGQTLETSGEAVMADALPLVKGTLDVLVLKALSWTPMHGFEITAWLERRSGGALGVQD